MSPPAREKDHVTSYACLSLDRSSHVVPRTPFVWARPARQLFVVQEIAIAPQPDTPPPGQRGVDASRQLGKRTTARYSPDPLRGGVAATRAGSGDHRRALEHAHHGFDLVGWKGKR